MCGGYNGKEKLKERTKVVLELVQRKRLVS